MKRSVTTRALIITLTAALGWMGCDDASDDGNEADTTVADDVSGGDDVADDTVQSDDTAAGPDTAEPADTTIADDTATADVGEPDTNPPANITFAEVVGQVVYPADCSNGYCHGGLMTDAEMLIGHVSTNEDCDTPNMVVPGDPESSLLWRKIAPGVDVCGDKMPKNGTPLSQAQADLVYDWILQGAN